MNYISYVESREDLITCHELGIKEVILTHQNLSRHSRLDTKKVRSLCQEAKSRGVRVSLEWDILVTESKFETEVFHTLESLLDAVRVQDLGVAQYVYEKSSLPIQLILETGNHNLLSIKTWEKYFASRLDRMILSSELNAEVLTDYCAQLATPIEILVWGRILLFYTPRKLVTIDDKFEMLEEYVEVSGKSEESPHNGFPIVENMHGTFMYHIKDLYLFDEQERLNQTQVSVGRVDLRHRSLPLLKEVFENKNLGLKELKKQVAPQSTKGYFLTNKTDVLFKKLKNHRVQRQDESYLGEVIDSAKDKYMVLNLRGEGQVEVGKPITFKNPDGKNKTLVLSSLRHLSGHTACSASKGLFLTDYVGGIWVKSQLYQADKKKAQGESILTLKD